MSITWKARWVQDRTSILPSLVPCEIRFSVLKNHQETVLSAVINRINAKYHGIIFQQQSECHHSFWGSYMINRKEKERGEEVNLKVLSADKIWLIFICKRKINKKSDDPILILLWKITREWHGKYICILMPLKHFKQAFPWCYQRF